MNKLALAVAAGGAALILSPVASFAQAADAYIVGGYAQPAPVVESSRTLCDAYGRCWRERTVTQREYVAPAPRGYVERRVIEQPATVYEEPVYVRPPAPVGVYGVGLGNW